MNMKLKNSKVETNIFINWHETYGKQYFKSLPNPFTEGYINPSANNYYDLMYLRYVIMIFSPKDAKLFFTTY